MSSKSTEEVVRHCVGRFCVEAPAVMTALGAYEMQGTTIEELDSSGFDAARWDQVWAQKIADIEKLKEDRRHAKAVTGEIVEQREVVPGRLRIVFYHNEGTPATLTALGLLRTQPAALWLKYYGARDEREEMARRIKGISEAYRPKGKAEQWPLPGKDWFYLLHGVVTLPFNEAEELQLGLKGHALLGRLDFRTQTTQKPDKTGLFDRLAKAVTTAGADYATGLSTVKSQKRSVAGLPGEEMIARDADAKTLHFIWRFPGKANSGNEPVIGVTMESKDERREEKTALWDNFLNSIRPAK